MIFMDAGYFPAGNFGMTYTCNLKLWTLDLKPEPGETNLFYTDRILNLAHRGARKQAPENTLPAFRLAAELGADGIELDAQLSKGGTAVVMHDFSVDTTTNGHGLVGEFPLTELKALDAGSHFSPEFAGTPIPTLEEVFAALGPVLLINVELKSDAIRDNGLEAEVIRLIEDFNLQDRVILSSFNPFALNRARRINPRIKRGYLWATNLPLLLRWRLLRRLAHEDMFHPQWDATTAQMVKRAHAQHHLLNVWTTNEPDDMRRMMALGVDAIMTDYPDRLRQVLHATG